MTGLMLCSDNDENVSSTLLAEINMADNCAFTISPKISYFFEMLDYEFKRAVRYKNAVTLMFIKLCQLDVAAEGSDGNVSERALSDVENIIRSNIRETDRGFKYGSDEFMIILPNTNKNSAKMIIEKLQQLIDNYRQQNCKGQSINLSPKFGIASYPLEEEGEVPIGKRFCMETSTCSNEKTAFLHMDKGRN